MANTVAQLIEQRGMSIAELSAQVGLSPNRLQAISEGRWLASPNERSKIAAALQVDIEQIVWGHTMSPRNVRYHQFGLPEDFSND